MKIFQPYLLFTLMDYQKNLTSETLEGKQFKRTIVVVHYCIVLELCFMYMKHITPEIGSSLGILIAFSNML